MKSKHTRKKAAATVFAVVTAKMDSAFLNQLSTHTQKHCLVQRLLTEASSDLNCWQADDGSWCISGSLNSIVEAEINLRDLCMRSNSTTEVEEDTVNNITALNSDFEEDEDLSVLNMDGSLQADHNYTADASADPSRSTSQSDDPLSNSMKTEPPDEFCVSSARNSLPRAKRAWQRGRAKSKLNKTLQCDICSRSFTQLSNLRRHIRAVHEENQKYLCPECPRFFYRCDTFARHQRSAHGNPILQCSACREVFEDKAAKAAHNCVKKPALQMCCDLCGKMLSGQSNLSKHKRLVHGHAEITCSECPKSFCSSMRLHRHLWRRHKHFSCPHCDGTFADAFALSTHMETAHGKKADRDLKDITHFLQTGVRKSSIKTKSTCAQCGKIFSSLSNMRKHVRMVHTGRRWLCFVCNRTFSSKWLVEHHVKTFHGTDPNKCPMCPAVFSQRHKLLLHQRQQHRDAIQHNGFQCETCGRSFLYKSNLLKHQKQKHVPTTHLCNHCGKEFSDDTKLRRHIRLWHEFRRYVCRVCSAAFCSASKQREHEIAQHTTLKPRTCLLCGATFARYSTLSYHLRRQHDVPSFAVASHSTNSTATAPVPVSCPSSFPTPQPPGDAPNSRGQQEPAEFGQNHAVQLENNGLMPPSAPLLFSMPEIHTGQ